VVAVDIPSGMSSDSARIRGKVAPPDYTVTFTAPKLGQVLPRQLRFDRRIDRGGHRYAAGTVPGCEESIWSSRRCFGA